MAEPIGSLCVLRDLDSDEWMVSICQGSGYRYVLRRFDSRDAAAAFAIAERERRMQTPSADASRSIHFPDDCPCHAEALER